MSEKDPTTADEVVFTRPHVETASVRFDVLSLQPKFSSPDHELYVSYLRDELNKPAKLKKGSDGDTASVLRPRNLALTGSYGSGKSSILSKIVEEFGDRVVSVSLSTLGSEEVNRPNGDEARKDPLETSSVTNSIQKEIVKQLLYRERPRKVPGSRYKRIERFRNWRAVWLAALIAGAVDIVVVLTGALGRVEAFFNHALWPIGASYAGLFIFATVAGWGVQLIFQNRLRVEKVTSGPASVSLTDTSESFFDKYLDELVYFFESNKYDIVIFEDLDRFNDPYIFETLRELNTLLNNSKQISPRVITFVYAIKDSIFEQLGALSINGVKLSPEEVRRLAVTNRTKFFDLVVPVVPFISQRNARDLLGKRMIASGFVIEPALIDRVSKYLVDMRLIKNVHNEHGIFKQKILGPGGVEELREDQLFAMVVYKNLHMSDFEKIKEGDSALDRLYTHYRTLVNRHIAAADQVVRDSQARLNKLDAVEIRSKRLGSQLQRYVSRLLEQAESISDDPTMTLTTAVTADDFKQASFWTAWLDSPDQELVLEFRRFAYLGGYGQRQVSFSIKVSLDDVRTATGDSLDPDDWQRAESGALRALIATAIDRREILKSASIADVLARTELKVDSVSGPRSLDEVARAYLGDGIALDLLRAGDIDRYFSLYVSLYYGDTVTALARNFVLHAVEQNVMDENATIGSPDEIEAMLVEAGSGIFAERSIFNTQIFDYLLAQEDERLEPALRRLASDGADEQQFLATYFSNGAHVDLLVSRLVRYSGTLLTRVLEDASFDEERRVALIDIMLASVSGGDYEVTPDLGRFVETNYRQLPSLLGETEVYSYDAVADVLEASGVHVASIAPLAADLKPLVIAKSLYRLTEENLVSALGGVTNLSLDSLRAENMDVYRYSGAHLPDYLPIAAASDGTRYSVDDREQFIDILNDLADYDTMDVERVIDRATPALIVRLPLLKESLWPLAAAAGRLQANYASLSAYIQKREGIDVPLARSLERAKEILGLAGIEDIERRGLAVALINTPNLPAKKRVELASSLALVGPLDVAELDLKSAGPELAGQLLQANFIGDSADVFAEIEDVGWDAQRGYMLASSGFTDYFPSIVFSRAGFLSLVEDFATSDEVKQTVLEDLTAFDEVLTNPALAALAHFAASKGAQLDFATLRRLAPAAESPVMVRLLDRVLDVLSLSEVVAILELMEYKYKRLTTLVGHTVLPHTPEDLRIADRLVRERQVSTRDPRPSGLTFRVNLRKKFD